MSVAQFNKLELTFAILKPHITAVPYIVKDIQNTILSNGFYIIGTKKSNIELEKAHEFYNEHREKFFFNRLVTFMCSGPCYFHILARENAIQFWRTMMGPTKVFKTIYSHPQSIRGRHGLSDTRNATHGSDSPESAEKEIKVFFPDFRVSDWYANEEKKFLRGDFGFDAKKFVHITTDDNSSQHKWSALNDLEKEDMIIFNAWSSIPDSYDRLKRLAFAVAPFGSTYANNLFQA